MKHSNKYNIIKRYLFGILNKEDAESLLAKSEEKTFISEIEDEMSNLWLHEVEKEHSNQVPAEYIYEASTLLHNIQKPKPSSRKYLLLLGSVAAILALLVFSTFHLVDGGSISQIQIESFASNNKVDIKDIAETQLVISDAKTILLDDKESTVTYNEDRITANQNDIAKEQVAAYNQLLTPKGKRSVLILSDGSKAWVNAGTRVIYPVKFADKEREIYVDGEIYIEVSRDKSRPFIVKTKDMNVQVLGTKFNVTAYETDATSRIVLAEGKVSVKTNQSKLPTGTVLSPNQMLELSASQETVQSVNPSKYISWIDGLYVYDDERLANVALALSRYYGVEIECSDKVSALLCTGKLDLKETVDEILELLSYSSPIAYHKEGNKYFINEINP